MDKFIGLALELFRKLKEHWLALNAVLVVMLSVGILFLFVEVGTLRRAADRAGSRSSATDSGPSHASAANVDGASVPAAAPSGQESREYHGPIIDAHAHVFDLVYFENLGWPSDPWTGASTPHYTTESLAQDVYAAWDRYNVVKAVVSGAIDDVSRWKSDQPDRVISAVILGGEFSMKSTDLIKRIENGDVAVLGELFSQYYGLRFDDASLERYYELAETYDLPVGVHTGLSNPKEIEDGGYVNFRAHLGNPREGLEEVLVRHESMRVYLMHAAMPFVEELDAILSMYPAVHIDLASVLQYIPQAGMEAFLRRFIVERDFGKRIMFGSDVYLWPDTQYRMSIEAINNMSFLSYEQKADIFCNNAAVFFRLPPETCSEGG